MYSIAFKDFLDQIHNFSQQAHGPIWYRGVNGGFPLDSGLFRLISGQGTLEQYLDLEKQLYMYYKNLGYLLHDNELGWGMLYSMQHHGVKTRLLDWSESLPVALYFACLGWEQRLPARIWLLDPSKLNLLSLEKQHIITPTESNYSYTEFFQNDNVKSFAIYPTRNNKRIIAQQGCFTVQGNTLKSLEKEFGDDLHDCLGLQSLEITSALKNDVINFVKVTGMNHFSIMPDLAGLSQHINDLLIPPAWK
ncbi:FRG domain-containing protein [Paenibacillus planticolens]|uniref:FRG domain-containing protein n=1 Tax=Paenibacillus planticolens TaxID=2654976 RepID=UPI001492D3A0|nr:FRG domain-containing protein [Paenibacillus planticolens]